MTHVARPLVLHNRVRPLARTPLATQAALVTLSLPRLLLSIPTGATKASTRNTAQYHTFAAVLQSNYVIPHQVILDDNIDSFCHPDAGNALMRAAANYPEEPPSDDDSA